VGVARIGDDERVDLLPGEQIIWTGQPVEHRLLRREDGLLIPFSLLWAGFAVFWTTQAASAGAPPFFFLFGGVFVLVGVYISVGRFAVRAAFLRNARYAVTDRRVIITGGLTGRSQHMDYLRSLQPPVIREHGDGTGDLAFGSFPDIFEPFNRRWGRGWAAWGESLSPPILRSIPSVRHVSSLILAAQEHARR
jgi:hypothetical protein